MRIFSKHLCISSFAAIGTVFGLAALPVTAQQSSASQGQAVQAKQEKPKLYDEKARAADQIASALGKAKRDNKRVLIQWGANWCGWCHVLDAMFKENRDISKTLLYEYEVVHVDIGRWDKHLDVAQEYEADFKAHGVPYLTVLDADGEVVTHQDTGALESEDSDKPGHDVKKVMEFLTDHQAPHLSAESVLADAMKTAARENKLVWLHIGAPWCGWCHRLEDWAHDGEIAKVLGKDFVGVKIDQDRMIGAKEIIAKYRKKGGGIPWFCFLKPDGSLVATSDVKTGNLGCPWTPQEKADFIKLLGEVTTDITERDIATIVAKLGDQK